MLLQATEELVPELEGVAELTVLPVARAADTHSREKNTVAASQDMAILVPIISTRLALSMLEALGVMVVHRVMEELAALDRLGLRMAGLVMVLCKDIKVLVISIYMRSALSIAEGLVAKAAPLVKVELGIVARLLVLVIVLLLEVKVHLTQGTLVTVVEHKGLAKVLAVAIKALHRVLTRLRDIQVPLRRPLASPQHHRALRAVALEDSKDRTSLLAGPRAVVALVVLVHRILDISVTLKLAAEV